MSCYNIIDSVKGGSGKTSFSLMLALAAQNQFETERGKGSCSILLDMDMQGSSLVKLLYGPYQRLGADGQAEQYFNDVLRVVHDKDTKSFLSKPCFHFSESGSERRDSMLTVRKIDAALASPHAEDRNKFRAVSRLNYSSQITYSAFRFGLERVLQEIDAYKEDITEYIFFDMPPNSNGYSEAVLELLLENKKERVNYFELTTLDNGHIEASLEWFKSFVNMDSYEFPDHFYFVFNNVPPYLASVEKEYFSQVDDWLQSKHDDVRRRILEILDHADHSLCKRISFVYVKYQEDYMSVCCKQGAIGSERERVILNPKLLIPIAFVIPLEEEVTTPGSVIAMSSATEALLKEMKGE